jgi:hypothetical protein
MEGAHDSDVVPVDQGLICVQRERKAEDLSQDACTDVQMHARMVGINQIWNTDMKHLNQNANTDVFF